MYGINLMKITEYSFLFVLTFLKHTLSCQWRHFSFNRIINGYCLPIVSVGQLTDITVSLEGFMWCFLGSVYLQLVSEQQAMSFWWQLSNPFEDRTPIDGARSFNPDSKVHGANMGPTWVLSAPSGPHVGPMNLAIREVAQTSLHRLWGL